MVYFCISCFYLSIARMREAGLPSREVGEKLGPAEAGGKEKWDQVKKDLKEVKIQPRKDLATLQASLVEAWDAP